MPSIRIGPTFCELMKMAKSVAAAMKTAAGSVSGALLFGGGEGGGGGVSSGTPGRDEAAGGGMWSGIQVVEEAEPLQHQPLIDQLDDGGLGRDQPGQPAGSDHSRV